MEIGEPKKTRKIEPVDDPVPKPAPGVPEPVVVPEAEPLPAPAERGA
jgi:hypothetical protein